MSLATQQSEDPAAPALRVAAWADIAGLQHGFFGRRGGVTPGACGSLNLSERVDDVPANVRSNWQRVRLALGGVGIVGMRQVHGSHVVRVDSAAQQVEEADAIVTDRPAIGLAVLTADCVPLLAVAQDAGVVLAAHAGWRGSLAGVALAALVYAEREMAIPPSAWRVALGPSIGGCCYEVERAIGQRFAERWGAMPDAWQAGGERGQLDLRQVNRQILVGHGVPDDQISIVGPCTACASQEYFSHRRSAGRAGRQASIIGFQPPDSLQSKPRAG